MEEEMKDVNVEEVDVAIDKVKLQPSELLRLVITKTDQGDLTIFVKSQKEVKEVSFFEVVGVLEAAKSDMLRQEVNQATNNSALEMTEIQLIQEDFDLDADGRLEASGKKVGDVIQIPTQIMELRRMAIDNLIKRKASGSSENEQK